MRCPHCGESTLHARAVKPDMLGQVCPTCQGVWLDRGQIQDLKLPAKPLEEQFRTDPDKPRPESRLCPRCDDRLQERRFTEPDTYYEECSRCGGLWVQANQLDRMLPSEPDFVEPLAENDPQVQEAARERLRKLAAGMLALPNLFLRSAIVLFLLYGILGLALVTVVQFGYLDATVALVIGIVVAVVQFAISPYILDLSLVWVYRFHWLKPNQVPEHLRVFVQRVCDEHGMKFPSIGLIHDGAPTAFTYGHHPSNARVVISEGILDLLEPAEVEAVVAHELGHARNWDMALMTMANIVPLLLYYLYYFGIRFSGLAGRQGRGVAIGIAIGAYVLYVVSEYIVLWFSRTREYFADRFAGQVTGNPNALASALVKIAYGLAAQGEKADAAKDKEKEKEQHVRVGALNALNIFDQKSAVGLVMSSAVGEEARPGHYPHVEQLKSAMQWDLWNPWALYYELHSTHPLVAKRLLYLTDQAAHLGQEPLVVFDRRKQESYWGSFFGDLFMMVLPFLCFLPMAVVALAAWHWVWLAVGIALAGVGSLLKTRFTYRSDVFENLTVAGLLHRVKVSGIRPVPTTVTGTIIGKGVPGLIWSEDFVLQDRTGIILLNYRQPLALWDFLFGLFTAQRYQGKEVRVTGWFRRAPVPFLEIKRIEKLDGSESPRRCYTYHARMAGCFLIMAIGIALTVFAVVQ